MINPAAETQQAREISQRVFESAHGRVLLLFRLQILLSLYYYYYYYYCYDYYYCYYYHYLWLTLRVFGFTA